MITIVFGKPGVGKTAYLTANAATYLNGSAEDAALYKECCKAVSALIAEGLPVKLPGHSPVYSNYAINVSVGFHRVVSSYYVDGFHMGFVNDKVKVFNLLPRAKVFLSEAQRYYNSRRSKDLPDWVSRYFEEHRHYGLDIWLDVQRPGLVDVNIRDITNNFVEVQSIRVVESDGRLKTVFVLNEFDEWRNVDAYLSGGTDLGKKRSVLFDFNVFDYFISESYFRNFLPSKGDFDVMPHVTVADVEGDVELRKIMYRQTAPEGFYK